MAKKTPQLVSLALLLKDAGWMLTEIGDELGATGPGIGYWLKTPEELAALSDRNRKWYGANRETVKARTFLYWQKNPEKSRERRSKWKKDNPKKCREYNRRYRATYPEQSRERDRKYRAANPEKRRASESLRRQKIRTYKPSPSERKAINQIYSAAKPGDHTDHIYPLAKGGLHHPWNLRNITAEENQRKGANVAPNTGPLVELVPGGFIPLPHFMI